ncbi:MAG TPA: hypothetical protein PLU35_06920 [Phycisphaerales bacterium]|nr:hypothetical protein [Phycisphaerales bacterium]
MTHPCRHFPVRPLLAVLAAGSLLTGCMSHHNDRATLGDSARLEAIDGHWAEPRPDRVADAPSLTGLERSNWALVRFEAGVDGVSHRPTYATLHAGPTDTARARGEFPTPISALDLESGECVGEIGHGFLGFGKAAIEGTAIVPGLFVYPQWRTGWSPKAAWQRAPDRARLVPIDEFESSESSDAEEPAAGEMTEEAAE